MASLRNSILTKIRDPYLDGEHELDNTIKFENKSGDVFVMKPREIKEVINNYLRDELEIFSNEVVGRHKQDIKTRLDFKLKQIENEMVNHFDDKINKITERIVELTMNRKIEEEVEKRLEAKLKKIKDSL